jgi:hypothetical protein
MWLPLNPFQQHRVFQLLFDNTSSAEYPLLRQHFRWPALLPVNWPNAASMVLHQGYTPPPCFTRRFDRCGWPNGSSYLRVLRSVRLIGLKREMITEKYP